VRSILIGDRPHRGDALIFAQGDHLASHFDGRIQSATAGFTFRWVGASDSGFALCQAPPNKQFQIFLLNVFRSVT
jgi:hypothetical protein